MWWALSAHDRPDPGRRVDWLDGDLTFDDVAHEYHDGRRSVDQLSLRFPAGALTAVTGERLSNIEGEYTSRVREAITRIDVAWSPRGYRDSGIGTDALD